MSLSSAAPHRLERPSKRKHARDPRGRLPVLPAGSRYRPEGDLQSFPVLQASRPPHHRPQVGQGQLTHPEPQGETLLQGRWDGRTGKDAVLFNAVESNRRSNGIFCTDVLYLDSVVMVVVYCCVFTA